jgi:hypothetical protein
MKRTYTASWLLLLGLLIMVSGSGILQSLLSEYQILTGPQEMKRMAINVKSANTDQGTSGMTVDQADKLIEKWGAAGAYAASVNQTIVHENTSVSSKVYGTNAAYPQFHQMWIRQGGFMSSKAVAEHSKVAVISSEFADQMFGSQKVIGLQIYIWNQPFQIIGVYEKKDSILVTATSDTTKPEVIIPATALTDYYASAKITSVDLAGKSNSRLSGISEVNLDLSAVDQIASSYTVVNGLEEEKVQLQKRNLLLMFLGIISMIYCIRLAVRQGKSITLHFRAQTEMKIWQDVVRDDWKLLSIQTSLGAAAIIVAILLWVNVSFPIYIPADKLPDRFINLSFYWDLVKQNWQTQISQTGYIPTQAEMMYSYTSAWMNSAFFAFLLLGLPLALLGIREWRRARFSRHTMFRMYCLYIVLAVIVTCSLESFAGLPIYMDWKMLILVSVLLFLHELLYVGRQMAVQQHQAETALQ